MADGYQFIHKPEDGPYSVAHIWSNTTNNTVCPTGYYIFEKDYIKTASPPVYGTVCMTCQRLLEMQIELQKTKNQKKPKMAPVRPEEDAYLKRWKKSKSAPSLWEKMDRDASFESAVKSRGGSMSNKWGIGKPKTPN